MLEQVFTKEFLTKVRSNTVVVLSFFKIVSLAIGLIGFVFCASGVDAPEPYGNNSFIGCIVCLGLLVSSMLSEMFTVKYLVKAHEHIWCIWDFNWYGLKNAATYAEYKREMKELAKKQQRRDENFKRMMEISNSFRSHNDQNVIQFSEFQNVRYNKPSKEENVRSM